MKFIAALPLALLPFLACGTTPKNGFEDAGRDDSDASLTNPDGSTSGGFDAGVDSPFKGCGTANYEAKQSPAALLFVLDASGTKADANKYSFAEAALIKAVDDVGFDTASLGLLLYPTGTVAGPACLTSKLPVPIPTEVACKVSGLSQVPLAPAGTEKTNSQTGVRHAIYAQLVASEPNKTGVGDGNPTYDALKVGINALKDYDVKGKRILIYITDGGASCTSLSTRSGYPDGNTETGDCSDWENPDNVVALLKTAHDDAASPVTSFVVGVPGADTSGVPACDPSAAAGSPEKKACDAPPYHVRNALSAYAFAGSPETVDVACTGKAYTQAGADPTTSCHFDMTQSYTKEKLIDAINGIRGKLLACVFDLPIPEAGTVDKGKVNVVYAAGGSDISPFKRKDPKNPCTDGCWDYTSDGKVELFGKACTDVKASTNAKVQIVVGCETMLK